MRKIFIIIISVFILTIINSCKDDPISIEEKVTISVKYYQPVHNYSNGFESFSAVASITWDGGNTTVANSSQSTNISVPKGATLTATYSSSFFNTYSGSTSNRNYKKTLVANGNQSWSL